jgi:hypothetical protein
MADTAGKPPKNPLEIRKKVLADPNTAQIAQKLGVPLEEYVEGVVHFAMNPQELPEYVGVTDEVLKEKFGLPPTPKDAEIIAIFDREVEYATVAEKTDYRDAKQKLVDLPEAPSAETRTEDAKLKEDLQKQLLGKKGGKA